MAATSWPARSKAVHNRRPTKPDAPATSTFTGPPEPYLVRPDSAARPDRPVTRTLLAYPAPGFLHRPAARDHRPVRPEPSTPSRDRHPLPEIVSRLPEIVSRLPEMPKGRGPLVGE
jgi:hypothetical protein